MRRPENLKKSPTCLTKKLFDLVQMSKRVEDFFNILYPFQKSWTLKPKKNGTIVYFTSKLFPTLQNNFLINLVDTIFSE